MKRLLSTMVLGICLSSAAFVSTLECNNDQLGIKLSIDLDSSKGTLLIATSGWDIKTYELEFKYVGDEHGPVGCTNLGPYTDYQLTNGPQGVNATISISGGYVTSQSANIEAPELSSPVSIHCLNQ